MKTKYSKLNEKKCPYCSTETRKAILSFSNKMILINGENTLITIDLMTESTGNGWSRIINYCPMCGKKLSH